ncbi:MAG: hypothetical protein RLZZ303_3644 [Candidatus Hydrogenedentota bacterium]|jgi:hypothetical protein
MKFDPFRYILLTTPGTIASKPMGHIAMKGFRRGALASATAKLLLGACVVWGALGVHAQNSVTATIESLQTGSSAHPEVVVQLQSSGLAPTSVVIFLAFDSSYLVPDSDYYETIARDGVGNVIRDEEGNATVFRSAVKPAASLAAAGKTIDFQVYAEDVIGVVISGINETPIPSGAVFSLGFRTQPGISAADSTALTGITAANAVNVTNPNTGARELAQSSAAAVFNGVETSLGLSFFGGTILFSCPGNTPAPTDVTASTNDEEAVVVSWNAGSALEFRVFRADSNNFSTAVPLGDGWTTARSFSDFSAAPGVAAPGGCFGGGGNTATQFYWVIARDATECESAPAGPVSGARAADKLATSPAGTGALGLGLCAALAAAGLRRRFRAAA